MLEHLAFAAWNYIEGQSQLCGECFLFLTIDSRSIILRFWFGRGSESSGILPMFVCALQGPGSGLAYAAAD